VASTDERSADEKTWALTLQASMTFRKAAETRPFALSGSTAERRRAENERDEDAAGDDGHVERQP
jgi:hypothetical protein